MSKIEPEARIVGTAGETTSKMLGGGGMLAALGMRHRHAVERIIQGRRNSQRAGEGHLGAAPVPASQMDMAELDGQLRHHRRDLEAAVEHLDRLVIALQREQQVAQLMEGGRIGRLALGRAPELEHRLVGMAGLTQRDREQGVDFRIVSSAPRLLQRRDRVPGTVLHQERGAENVQRTGMARLPLQEVGRNPLRVVRALAPQGRERRLQHVVTGRAAVLLKSGTVGHHPTERCAPFQEAIIPIPPMIAAGSPARDRRPPAPPRPQRRASADRPAPGARRRRRTAA